MIKTLFVSVLVVLLGSLPAAPALGAQPITTDVQVPFSETVFYDLSNESLPLTGAMHVSTEVTPKGSLSVRINLDGVSGIGEITSIR